MAKKKLEISDVYKKDLRILGFLLINGLVAWGSMQIDADPILSIILGGAANYIAFRALEELKGEGYRKALK